MRGLGRSQGRKHVAQDGGRREGATGKGTGRGRDPRARADNAPGHACSYRLLRQRFCSFSSRTCASNLIILKTQDIINVVKAELLSLLEGKEEELDPPTSPTPTPPPWWNSGLLRAPLLDACSLRAGWLSFLPSFPSSLFLSNTQITAHSKLTLARAAL